MNKEQLLKTLTGFSPNSRIWIYQSDRILSSGELDKIDSHIQPFAKTWAHHGKDLKSYAAVLYDMFIIFVVDETMAEVGGCGIDSSVHLVQKIGSSFDIDFFKRMDVATFYNDKPDYHTKEEFSILAQKEDFDINTLVFNNQVKTLEELKNNWIISFKNSWHQDFFSKSVNFNLSL